jgi:hypothetical protein
VTLQVLWLRVIQEVFGEVFMIALVFSSMTSFDLGRQVRQPWTQLILGTITMTI